MGNFLEEKFPAFFRRVKNTKKNYKGFLKKTNRAKRLTGKLNSVKSKKFNEKVLRRSPFLKSDRIHFRKKKRKDFDTTDYILTVSNNHIDHEIMLQRAITLRLFSMSVSREKIYPFFQTMDMFNVYVELFKQEQERQRVSKKILQAIKLLKNKKIRNKKLNTNKRLVKELNLIIRFLTKYLEGFLYLNPIETPDVKAHIFSLINSILFFAFLSEYFLNISNQPVENRILNIFLHTIPKKIEELRKIFLLQDFELNDFEGEFQNFTVSANTVNSSLLPKKLSTPRKIKRGRRRKTKKKKKKRINVSLLNKSAEPVPEFKFNPNFKFNNLDEPIVNPIPENQIPEGATIINLSNP